MTLHSFKMPRKASGMSYHETLLVGPTPGTKSKKMTHCRQVNIIELYGTPEEACAVIMQAAEGLEEPLVDLEDVSRYGEERYQVTVSGWRPMTEEELAEYAKQDAKEKEVVAERKARQDEADLERIKREHPEWLSNDLLEGK